VHTNFGCKTQLSQFYWSIQKFFTVYGMNFFQSHD
jgi:hypothetical protein